MNGDISCVGHKRHIASPKVKELPPKPGLEMIAHKRRTPAVCVDDDKKMCKDSSKKTFYVPPMFESKGDYLHVDMPSRTMQEGPSTAETRFHKGFNRRSAKVIDSTTPFKDWEKEREVRRVIGQENRRNKLIVQGNYNGVNPITNGQPLVGEIHDGGFSKSLRWGLRSKALILEENLPVSQSQEQQQLSQERKVLRTQKKMREGLSVTEKNWSVADQFHCYDVYDVSKTVSNEGTVHHWKNYSSKTLLS